MSILQPPIGRRGVAHHCSRHALVRMQQRRIPDSILELLLAFGKESRTAKGSICFFDKHARSRLMKVLPEAESSNINRYLHCYLVEGDDGKIITVGHRYKRIRRG